MDVGCGPGASTALLISPVGARRVVGLDQSARFVESARSACRDGSVRFEVCDLTTGSLPVLDGGDLVWARFLLAHLPNVDAVLGRLVSIASPDGVVAVEEVEAIETSDDVLGDYLAVAAHLVSSRGGRLLAGPVIEAAADPPTTRRLESRVTTYQVPAGRAAQLFLLNLKAWSEDPAVTRRFDPARLRTLRDQERLQADTPATWKLRQIAWRRHEN